MKKLLSHYLAAFRSLAVTKKSWSRYVIDLFIVIGLPIGIVFLILSFFAAGGVPCLLSDGEPVVGIPAILTGLAIAFVFVPFLCVFVGSIAWIMNRSSM